MNQKGGAGKTTLLLHLLITAWLKGAKVSLVDLDPQRSAEKWYAHREARTRKDAPVIVHALVDELSSVLEEARRKKVDLVMIDTPAAIDKTMIYSAAAADLIVVPTRTAQIDIDALEETLQTLKNMHALAKVVVVMNAPRAKDKKGKGGGDEVAVRDLAEKRFGVPVASVVIDDLADLSRSLDAGKGIAEQAPKSAAAKDIAALFKYLEKQPAPGLSRIGRASA